MSANDMLGLAGKVAIVWGGGYSMGERTSRRLAEAGCAVAVVDLVPERARTVAEDLAAQGVKSIGIAADATDVASVDSALAEAEAALGPVDVMATVIGLGIWGQILDQTMEQWEEAWRINLTSFWNPARAVARSLIAHGKPGAIACVSSVSGLTAAPNHAGYGAAKAGMINLVRTMANEWGPHGIRVNAAMPGVANTLRLQMSEEQIAHFRNRLPLGRPADPDELAKAIVFLLSDLASYVTGHNLHVDGGWTSVFLMQQGFGPVEGERT
ncbi:MAG: SDR family oxidoreductase [Novosphingobium sp.]|nr:SDR family oxidoreductase [Novosphingobium sp.]